MKKLLLAVPAALLVIGTLAPAAPAASAALAPQDLVCDNSAATPYTGTYRRVTVRAGDYCYLRGATVTGGVHACNAHTVRIIDTAVARNIHITGTTHDVMIGSPGCRYDPQAGNNIMVTNSHNVLICWETVGNNIKVSRNDGRITLHHNRAGNSISVVNNLPFDWQAGDGQHGRMGAIRFRQNTADNHNRVRNNAGRAVIASGNTPAIG